VNVAEEAVSEDSLPYKELFASAVPGQDHKAAATSCFLFTPVAMKNSSAN